MNGTRNSFDLGQEIRLVPWWSYLLGGIGFVCMQFVFNVVILHGHEVPPPAGLRVFLGLLTGFVLAAYLMLLGYVNVDAGRRGMNRTLWTLVVIVIPNLIGYLIYFFLRKPLQLPCPQCGTLGDSGATFCRKCGNRLKPACQACGASIEPGDAFCAACGKPTTIQAV